MNIISYDIELTRRKKVKGEILVLINACFAKSYKADTSNRTVIENTWDALPYQDYKTVFSSTDLLYSFTTENVQVFVSTPKKQTVEK